MVGNIKQLIKEMCPNGVEYKNIGEICDRVFAGGTPSTSKEEYYNGGTIPWLRSGEINFNSIYDAEIKITELGLEKSSAKMIKEKSAVIAMTGATVARSAVIEKSMCANQSVCAMEPKSILNYKYLYYCLASDYETIKGKSQGALTSINISIIKELKIPVPPVEVQNEIVRILDNFTELEAELETELDVRKIQYKYYRDKLLDLEDGCVNMSVGEFSKVEKKKNKERNAYEPYSITQQGLIPTKEFFGEKANITSSDTSGYYVVQKNWFVYSPSRIDVGSINYLRDEGPVIVTSMDVVFSIDDNIILQEYLLQYLLSHSGMHKILCIREGVEGMGRKNLPFDKFSKIEIPVPSIEEQKRRLKILNKFYVLTNDITEGLPAEISMRHKQYEYYRDKLLSFN